jgi:anaphase-promoting complex subunit 10
MATESEGEEDVATTAAAAGGADGGGAARLRGSTELSVDKEWLREVGKNAAWTVSSFKPGNGVSCLLDSNLDTFWQLVNIYTLSFPLMKSEELELS